MFREICHFTDSTRISRSWEMGTVNSIQNIEAPEITSINFRINGAQFNLDPLSDDRLTPGLKLVDFIRDWAQLKGTKSACREGGCGACIINVRTGNGAPVAVNSCLVPLWTVDNWEIFTIESVGSSRDGYHEIQKKLAQNAGTQCGFCTPGMIMNMHGFLQSGSKSKMEIQDALDGNICRCTGYRPIVQTFQSFGNEAIPSGSCCQNVGNCQNFIEDHPNENFLLGQPGPVKNLHLKFISGQEWFRPIDLASLFYLLGHASAKKFKIIARNTASSILDDDAINFDYFIDISAILELRRFEINQTGITLGSGLSFAEAIDILQKAGQMPSYPYAAQMVRHLRRIGGTSIRNRATLGGNLMLKYIKPEFNSDLFLLLEGVGARLRIVSPPNSILEVTPLAFLGSQMVRHLLLNIWLPPIPSDGAVYIFNSYKIARRYQNDGALVNIALQFTFDGPIIKSRPNIVFGCFGPALIHARATEDFLMGKNLKESGVLKGALEVLDAEMSQVNPSKSQMALNLFYKMILALYQNSIDAKLKSGASEISRSLTSGMQTYYSDKKDWPLGEPLVKIEALAQTSGQVEYVNDIPHLPDELFGEFVLSTLGPAQIDTIDTSEALKLDGVVDFITDKDIPGENNFFYWDLFERSFFPATESDAIFSTDEIKYAGQAIGLVLARSQELAREGARRIKVTYKNVRKPRTGFENLRILEKSDQNIASEFDRVKVDEVDLQKEVKIEEIFEIGPQFPFPLESIICIVIPQDGDQLKVISSSQWIFADQHMICKALKLPYNSISITSRTLGGSFGLKASRHLQASVAAAVGAWKTRKPVRINMGFDSLFRMCGKRSPQLLEYSVAFDSRSGRILRNASSILMNWGCSQNESFKVVSQFFLQSCYKIDGWKPKVDDMKTDTAPNGPVRNPGGLGPIILIETIMDHIGKVLKKDPIEIRLENLLHKGDMMYLFGHKFEEENPLPEMIKELRASADYAKRKVEIQEFNAQNRWMKKGLGFSCYRFPIFLEFFIDFVSIVSIYQQDGSVSIAHTAIDMGQGVNTKCVQVVANVFGIPPEKIKVRPIDNLIAPQNTFTAASHSTNLSTYSVHQAAMKLLERMEPVKKKLGKEYTWEKLVQECWNEKLELSATYKLTKEDKITNGYSTWGCIFTEIQLDVLTGENKISRVDAMVDAGVSLNPLVDIGQIEGGLILGFGYLFTEKISYDEETGKMDGKGTFDYKPPMAKDIPEDFRVSLWKNEEKNHTRGNLGSKSMGEAPVSLAVSGMIAIREAIDSARKDAGNQDIFYRIDWPITPQDIVRLCLTTKDNLNF